MSQKTTIAFGVNVDSEVFRSDVARILNDAVNIPYVPESMEAVYMRRGVDEAAKAIVDLLLQSKQSIEFGVGNIIPVKGITPFLTVEQTSNK